MFTMRGAPVLLLALIGFAECADLWRDSNLQLSEIPNSDRSFGESNMRTVNNPAGGTQKVLRIFYPRNSYKPSSSPQGGAQFFKDLPSSRTIATLTYDIYFARNFNFVKGGKLPGLYGGSRSCSGGRSAEGCFSTRYMFRSNGDGEIYLYAPSNQRSSFCSDSNVYYCNFDHGHSLGRGNWRFSTGRWYTISQRVRLNDVGQKNGYVQVWLDGRSVLKVNNVNFRNSNSVKIDGMYFSTFFGGGSTSWKTPVDTYTYYRNFKITS